MNVNFQDIVGNISNFLNKNENKNENKTVVIVDNLSTIPIENSKFSQEFNKLFNYCAENVFFLLFYFLFFYFFILF